jgi:hypothetical protein
MDFLLNMLKEHGVSEEIINQVKTHLEGVDITNLDAVKAKLVDAGVSEDVVSKVSLPDAGGLMGMVNKVKDMIPGLGG